MRGTVPGKTNTLFIDLATALLRGGYRIRFTARGQSMAPAIRDGDRITIEAVEPRWLHQGDIVLCRTERGPVVHRVAAIASTSEGISTITTRGDGSSLADQPIELERIEGRVVETRRPAWYQRVVRKTARRIPGFAGRAPLFLSVLLAFSFLSGSSVSAQRRIEKRAWEQIRALQAEKASRTPAQRKMASTLVHAVKRDRGQSIGPGLGALRKGIRLDARGLALVRIRAEVTPGLLEAIALAGGEVVRSHPWYGVVHARLPLASLESLAGLSQVRSIRPALPAVTRKRNTSEGDVAHRAVEVRADFGVDGTGIAVGVLSDSVDYLDRMQRSGDLPGTVTVLQDAPGNSGEGTAMLEIVYDLAPGADLYFATAWNGMESFADNIEWLRSAGCDIIVDDVGYLAEEVFEDGVIARAVDTVVADGALYFSSAGNSGNYNDGTSGVWEGDFAGVTNPYGAITDAGLVADFGGGTTYNEITGDPPSYIIMQWSDKFGASGNDYDLYLLNPDLDAVFASSTNVQDGDDDPLEFIDSISYNDVGNHLVVLQTSGADARYLHLNTHRGRLSIGTDGQIHGHAGAAGAMAVAAVDVATAGGGAFTGGASNPIETFSSDGPRHIFYQSDGSPVTPGNFLASGAEVRQKPEVAAADGVSCATPGFDPFYGTSAAAPHAAAIAALLWSRDPSQSAGDIDTTMTTSVLDIEANGVDRDSGFGIPETYGGMLTEVDLLSAEALVEPNGRVLIRWRTGYEVDNLGFHLYRQQAGEWSRLTPSLVAGSALVVGEGIPLTAGRSYLWIDPEAGARPSAGEQLEYWLQDVDLDGTRSWHGPILPRAGEASRSEVARSLLLAELARRDARAASRAQSLRRRLQSVLRVEATRVGVARGIASGRQRQGEPGSMSSVEAMAVQRRLASSGAVKIRVDREGWHRVGRERLVAAGLNPSVDPRRLELFADGIQQAILVTGAGDGRFDAGDALEFYGRALDTPWTGARTYWLVEGRRRGLRLKRQPASGGRAGEVPIHFSYTVEQSPRDLYVAAILNGEAENFFGPAITAAPADLVIELPHLDTSTHQHATLWLSLQGATREPHQVQLLVNQQPVAELHFTGAVQQSFRVSLPQALLLPGSNLVTLVSAGGETDVSLLERLALTYWRRFWAQDDRLRLQTQGYRSFVIEGFSVPSLRVLDISEPNKPVELEASVSPGTEGYSVRVDLPSDRPRTLLAFTDAAVTVPAAIESDTPSAWRAALPGASALIISHRRFLAGAARLAELRRWQGWSVEVIDVQDLYDEFAFGAKTPHAVRDFLQWALGRWRTAPEAVLLLGDASFDPRNRLNLGDFDLVPTGLVDTSRLETASDGWFGDLDGSGLPFVAIGRLPVRTEQEAQTAVAKLVDYERAAGQPWTGRALFVADEQVGYDFEAAAGKAMALLPGQVSSQQIFVGELSVPEAREQLLSELDRGQLLVNYLGHGSVESWVNGSFMTSGDARELGNGERLPLVVSMTCLNGFFHDLYTDSLAEALLLSEQGGAVAVWASSGLTEAQGQFLMNQELMRLLFAPDPITVGQAAAWAKAVVSDRDIRNTWNLLGDPMLRLHEPPSP